MSTVPQWNADIITQDVEAEAEIQANGGLEKDSSGAIGVNVDNETIVINQDGELEATLSDRDSAYVATYGTTTYQELSDAHTAGKAIFVVGVSGALSAVMPMTSFSTNPAMAIFMIVIGDVEYQAKIDQDVWSSTSVSLQANWNESNQLAPSYIANKPTVDQIYDSTSTNAQSGTAVAGALATLPKFNTFKGKFAPGTSPSMNGSSKCIHYWKDTTSTDNIWVFIFGNDLYSAFKGNTNLLEITESNISYVSATNNMFEGCTSLTSVLLFDTSSVLNTSSMFKSCSSLTSVPLYNTSSVTDMSSMFSGCSSLESVPLFDMSRVTGSTSAGGSYGAKTMFENCTSLTSVPLFNLSSAVCTRAMFRGCVNVESGALALYTQTSTQTTPPSAHTDMFTNCGANTTTGAAELAQITTDWGGTMA